MLCRAVPVETCTGVRGAFSVLFILICTKNRNEFRSHAQGATILCDQHIYRIFQDSRPITFANGFGAARIISARVNESQTTSGNEEGAMSRQLISSPISKWAQFKCYFYSCLHSAGTFCVHTEMVNSCICLGGFGYPNEFGFVHDRLSGATRTKKNERKICDRVFCWIVNGSGGVP